jgi:hypothetical protein
MRGYGARTFGDNIHLTVHVLHFVFDTGYFAIDGMREPQDLCVRHPSDLLRQSVQPYQGIFYVLPSCQLLEEFF